MEKYYTVTGVKPTGWDPDNYGNVTDSVFFEGEQNTALFKHSPKTEVAIGKQFYGKVTDEQSAQGKPYRKFTRTTPPEDTSTSSYDGSTSRSNAGDGAKQGMAINNAAKYVVDMAVKNNRDLDPKELADEIEHYAKEIYKIDLTVTVNDNPLDEVL